MNVLRSFVHAVAVIAASTILSIPVGAACLEPIGAIPDGPTLAVDVEETLGAYGRGRLLMLLDLTDPEDPVALGSVVLPGIVVSVQLDGGHAWVAAGAGGLVAVDVSDPLSPEIVGLHPAGLDGEPAEVIDAVVTADLAYLVVTRWVNGRYYGGLRVVDVSSVTSPAPLGEELWPYLRFDGAVTVTDGLALIADRGLVRMIDVSHPTHPRWIGNFGVWWGVRRAAAAGTTAYVATSHEILVVDLDDFSEPVSELETNRQLATLHVDGDLAYLVGGLREASHATSGLTIVDVSDPRLPHEVAFVESPVPIVDVAVDGGRALLAAADHGVRVADVSNPADARITSVIGGVGPSVRTAADGGLAVVVRPGSMSMVDLTDAAHPLEGGVLPISFEWYPGYRPALDSSIAFVASDWPTGIGVYDASDPVSPEEISFLDIDDGFAADLVPAHPYLYALVIDFAQGHTMRVVDVENPASPVFVSDTAAGQGQLPFLASVDGDRAAVSTWPCGPDDFSCSRTVEVFDLSSPTQPVHVDAVHQDANAVLVHDGFIFAAGYDGVTVYDARDPAGLVEVAFVATDSYDSSPETSGGIALHEETLYVAKRRFPGGVVHVIDVSDPLRPRLIGEHATPGGARDLAVADGHLLVADGDGGLLVLAPTSCLAPPPRRGGGRR